MKKLLTCIAMIITLITTSLSIQAQNFERVLEGGLGDAQTYLTKYLNPAANSIGNGISNGWYNTAKPHKTLGFDLTFSTNVALIPSADQVFEFVSTDYDNITALSDPSDNVLPTFFGGDTEQELVIDGRANIDAPEGILAGLAYSGSVGVPTPTLQLGVGIVKNTDLIIRFTPQINAGDFSFQSFGFGVKHDFKQWIPVMKLLPFDLSALMGFNRITTSYQLDDVQEQIAEFGASSTTVQAIISKKLSFFTPYAGVGFNIVKSNLALKGTYEFDGQAGTSETEIDPIDIEFDGSGGPRFTAGFRLKILWILALNVDYTFQKYNTLSMGFGLNIR